MHILQVADVDGFFSDRRNEGRVVLGRRTARGTRMMELEQWWKRSRREGYWLGRESY